MMLSSVKKGLIFIATDDAICVTHQIDAQTMERVDLVAVEDMRPEFAGTFFIIKDTFGVTKRTVATEEFFDLLRARIARGLIATSDSEPAPVPALDSEYIWPWPEKSSSSEEPKP